MRVESTGLDGVLLLEPRCFEDTLRGAVIDYAVDIRPDSPTFGRYVGVELSAANRRQLLIPAGFAHGFCTLADDTEVLYKASDFYAPADEGGIVWNDRDLSIDWPVREAEAILSERDCALPGLSEALRC